MSELLKNAKPCPFCACDPENIAIDKLENNTVWQVNCTCCGKAGPWSLESAADALDQWNTREEPE